MQTSMLLNFMILKKSISLQWTCFINSIQSTWQRSTSTSLWFYWFTYWVLFSANNKGFFYCLFYEFINWVSCTFVVWNNFPHNFALPWLNVSEIWILYVIYSLQFHGFLFWHFIDWSQWIKGLKWRTCWTSPLFSAFCIWNISLK